MAFLFKCIGFDKSMGETRNQVDIICECDQDRKDAEDGAYGGFISARRYSWNEVGALTSGLSEVIGSGGYSNVYKGRLSGSAAHVAVKIHLSSDRLYQVFRQELDILLRLRHDNIVKFHGYCEDSEEGALVFEYLPGGNLQEKLHGSSKEVLPWRKRTAIAFQLVRAIEYLHEGCSPQIVHGDIKSSNILLDRHQNCKLCDFGTSKIGFSSMVQPLTLSLRSRQVMMIGSPGYTDPHYLRTGIASKKNDVYGLGVVVLELVTGKEAFCPERGEMLVQTAAPLLEEIVDFGAVNVAAEKVARFVDRRLAGEYDLEEAKAMLLVSALCLRQPPSLRPSAGQLSQELLHKIPSLSFLSPPAKDCTKAID